MTNKERSKQVAELKRLIKKIKSRKWPKPGDQQQMYLLESKIEELYEQKV